MLRRSREGSTALPKGCSAGVVPERGLATPCELHRGASHRSFGRGAARGKGGCPCFSSRRCVHRVGWHTRRLKRHSCIAGWSLSELTPDDANRAATRLETRPKAPRAGGRTQIFAEKRVNKGPRSREKQGCLVRNASPRAPGRSSDDEGCRVSTFEAAFSRAARHLGAAMPQGDDGCREHGKGSNESAPPVTGERKFPRNRSQILIACGSPHRRQEYVLRRLCQGASWVGEEREHRLRHHIAVPMTEATRPTSRDSACGAREPLRCSLGSPSVQ